MKISGLLGCYAMVAGKGLQMFRRIIADYGWRHCDSWKHLCCLLVV